MARARYLHPSIMSSPSVQRLGPAGSFFWCALLLLVDDEGRIHDSVGILKGNVYPYPHSGVGLKVVERWLRIMHEEGMILRYVADNGSRYIQVVNWRKYNKVSHPKPSMLPAPNSGRKQCCRRS